MTELSPPPAAVRQVAESTFRRFAVVGTAASLAWAPVWFLSGVPSIGCAKTMLVGEHGPLGFLRGSTAEIVHQGETVGVALRTRDGCNPVYVSPGHRMDLETAVALVLAMSRYRLPETTRRSHALVNDLRRADKARAGEDGGAGEA